MAKSHNRVQRGGGRLPKVRECALETNKLRQVSLCLGGRFPKVRECTLDINKLL